MPSDDDSGGLLLLNRLTGRVHDYEGSGLTGAHLCDCDLIQEAYDLDQVIVLRPRHLEQGIWEAGDCLDETAPEEPDVPDLFTEHIDSGDWVLYKGSRYQYLEVTHDPDGGYVRYEDPFGSRRCEVAHNWQEAWQNGALEIIEEGSTHE